MVGQDWKKWTETFQEAGIMVAHVTGGSTICKSMVGGI